MFGYVQVRKPELKIKDYEVYHGFYCGLCYVLKEKYGFFGQMTLTYDMTFLVLLLSSVYDVPVEKKRGRCIAHPGKKHLRLYNEMTEYAAHMNMILTYYHLKDDREDEASKKAWLGMQLYRGKERKAAGRFRKQEESIVASLKRLSELERQGETDILKLADCFGMLMQGLFCYKEDVFSGYFKDLGYHLGRFIYVMDALDDMEKDEKKGCFNPLIKQKERQDFIQWITEILLDEMAAAGAAYQKLPCVEYSDILGNILYAGVWNRFDEMMQAGKLQDVQESSTEKR